MKANGSNNSNYYDPYKNTPAPVTQKVKTAEIVYHEKNSNLKNRVSTAEQMKPSANTYAPKASNFPGVSHPNVMGPVTFSSNISRGSAMQNNNRNPAIDFNKLNKKKNHIHESPE